MSTTLPEDIGQLAKSFFITICYLAPKIIAVDLQIPNNLTEDLESYRYRHKAFDHELSLIELAQVWTTPNLIRTISRLIVDWDKAKFAKLELSEIYAEVLFEGQQHPIQRARISYELNYGELGLPLSAVQELSILDGAADIDVKAFAFGEDLKPQSEIIVDEQTGTLRWDILGKSLLNEGKVLIGARLKASKPVSITTMRLDL